ncbi:MAG TPA: hypothetical protein VFF04_06630 [Candidatus Babeliales bacterium]|nr:hypothetical protein [Candidatus Babeliales bacterium]
MHKCILLLSLLSLSAVASEKGATAHISPTESGFRKYIGFAMAGVAVRTGFLLADYFHKHIVKSENSVIPESDLKLLKASKQAQTISDLQNEINNDTEQLGRFKKIVASIPSSDPDYERLKTHADRWQISNKARCEQILKLTAKHIENNQSLLT